MEKHLVYNLPNSNESGRNSEGSFLRAPNGDILFAYSHYISDSSSDDAPCDIAMIRSVDEGESWSEPVTIARASDFGVTNIMSVSGMTLKDGSICFFFIVKEDADGSSWLGRTISADGEHFATSRCGAKNVQRGYYVFNNDRFIRLSDGRIATTAAKYNCANTIEENRSCLWTERFATPVCFVSDDEGESFTATKARIAVPGRLAQEYGMEEPGIIELPGGVIWLWARTTLCYQYQCYSFDGMNTFTPPEPSVFTSPRSPMEIYRTSDGDLWAVYNPVPHYNGCSHKPHTGRTPFVLQRSRDNGQTWGSLYVLEDDPNSNFCYPAMIETKDGSLLCSYMSTRYDETAAQDGKAYLEISMRIMKIKL